MTIETKQYVNQDGTPNVAPAEAPKPAEPPKSEAKPDAKPEGEKKPAEAKPDAKVEAKPEGEKPAKADAKTVGEDDELPDDDELISLKASALKKRIGRAAKKELKERFGTDDFEVIKKKLDAAAAAEEKSEEERRAQLTKEKQLEEDLEKERAKAKTLEEKIAAQEFERAASQADKRVTGIAGKFVDEADVDDVLEKYARHIKKEFLARGPEGEKELAKLTDKQIEKWFEKFVKDHPKWAKAAAKPEAEKAPINNGANDDDREKQATGDGLAGKTFAPGRPNSMSSAEAKAAAARAGYRW